MPAPSPSPTPSTAPAAPRRRTQRERRETTRRRLLDATVSSLVELGYARTTTTEVCARAGLSQGALFKYFPTKRALIAEATEHLFGLLIEDFRAAFEAVDGSQDRIGVAIEALWQVFCLPRLQAAFDLYAAARTDPDLAVALEPIAETHAANILAVAESLFPATAAANPRFAGYVGLAINAMQGAALGALAHPDEQHARTMLNLLGDFAREGVIAADDLAPAARPTS